MSPATPEELKALLVPYRGDALTMWPVNRQRIGNVRNKDREVSLPEASTQVRGGAPLETRSSVRFSTLEVSC